MPKMNMLFGLYKGDEFLDVDTAEALAEKYNIKRQTIYFYASPAYKRRIGNNDCDRIVAVRFDEEAEF